MTPHDDELLARLAAIDPAPTPESVTAPTAPAAQAVLREVLAMSTTDTHTPDTPTSAPAPEPEPVPWWRRPALIGAAAAAVIAVAIGSVALTGDDAPSDDIAAEVGLDPDADSRIDDANGDLFPGGEPDDGVSPGGASSELTSCVEMYSLETLGNRTYALDGTITAIDDETNLVTFEVNEWFKGGDGPMATKDGVSVNHSLLDPATGFEPGTRVMVAGDDEFVWTCGFTQLYSPELADEWRTALQ